MVDAVPGITVTSTPLTDPSTAMLRRSTSVTTRSKGDPGLDRGSVSASISVRLDQPCVFE